MLLQTPPRPRMPPVRKAGPYFGCGGDHWLRDCPDRPVISYKGEKLPPIERYCIGCSVEHLSKVCPHRPSANPPGNQGSNQGLNYIEVIPSPFADEEEKDRASLRVMTRAQTPRNIDKEEPPASEAVQKKSRKRYNRRGRPKKEEKKSKSGSEPRQPANEQEKPEGKKGELSVEAVPGQEPHPHLLKEGDLS